MKRKKWTAQTEVTDALLKFREKRKWQIALRRYVLEGNRCVAYAPFFGLDIEQFRSWIALQFTEDMNWENFSTVWQLDHVVPVTYFNFSLEDDLKLCWNFTNIRAEKLEPDHTGGSRVDVLGAKAYFEHLYQYTQHSVCIEMVKKIEQIEAAEMSAARNMASFIQDNKDYIDTLSGFTALEYDQLNRGTALKDILAERELMRKFGG